MNSMPSKSSIALNSSKKQTTKFEKIENVHRQLLYELMSAIYEYDLVSMCNSSTQNSGKNTNFKSTTIDSLLIHIHTRFELIFSNGFRIFKPDVSFCFYLLLL